MHYVVLGGTIHRYHCATSKANILNLLNGAPWASDITEIESITDSQPSPAAASASAGTPPAQA